MVDEEKPPEFPPDWEKKVKPKWYEVIAGFFAALLGWR